LIDENIKKSNRLKSTENELLANLELNKKKVLKILDYASETIELDNFSFYWWGVLDLVLWKDIYDIDLAIQWTKDEQISKLNEIFISKWFKIVHSKRYYPISNDKIDAYLVYAKNDKYFFDVAFIEDPDSFGLFNLDSSYCKTDERKFVDNYGAIDGLLSKTIKPIKSLDWENPLCFFSRFIRLSSKYEIPMYQTQHTEFINNITKKLNDIDPLAYERLYWSTISSIFKAIIKSRNTSSFCRDLLDTDLLKSVFPELEIAIKNIDTEKLSSITNRNEMINLLEKAIDWDISKWFKNRISFLNNRSWE